jgi:hypothetical protein
MLHGIQQCLTLNIYIFTCIMRFEISVCNGLLPQRTTVGYSVGVWYQ